MQTVPARLHVLRIIGNAIVGGMETHVIRLLERLPREHFHATVVAPFESRVTAAIRALGIDVLPLPITLNAEWPTLQVISALVKAQSIDVMHAHLENAHLVAGLVGRITGKPVLANVHGRNMTLPDLEAHRTTGTHIAVVCKHGYYHAIGLGVNPAQLHLLPNGVDHVAFAPRSRNAALRTRWGVPERAPLVGFVGRLSHEKGPDDFVDAALRVHACVPEAHFVVAGEGPLTAELRGFLERHRMHYVHLVGMQSDMPALYAEVDLLVVSSRSEGTPLALMEAMACGVPAVARRVGGVADIVLHGTTGLLAASDDADGLVDHVVELLNDPVLLQRMGAAARERIVQHFTLDDNVAATTQLLRRLAQGRTTERRLSALPDSATKPRGEGSRLAASGMAKRSAGGEPAA